MFMSKSWGVVLSSAKEFLKIKSNSQIKVKVFRMFYLYSYKSALFE